MILNFITPYVSMPGATKFGIKISNFKVRVINKRKYDKICELQGHTINSKVNAINSLPEP